MLHAMTTGIDRVNRQQILNEMICMWLPAESETAGVPRVLPDYYAMPFAADFIGASGRTRVVELSVEGERNAKIVGNAAYDGGNVARIALVHLMLCSKVAER